MHPSTERCSFCTQRLQNGHASVDSHIFSYQCYHAAMRMFGGEGACTDDIHTEEGVEGFVVFCQWYGRLCDIYTKMWIGEGVGVPKHEKFV